MQKPAKPNTRTQQSRKPVAPPSKQALPQTSPQLLDAEQLRQVAGGYKLPNGGW